MDLVKLLNDLVANIAALQSQLADAQASAQALADLKYKEGFDAGVASVVIPPVSDKVYSQEELEAKIQEALLPLQAQLVELQAQIDAVPAQIEQAKADAVAQFKVDFLEKYKAAQVAESQIENSIEELLK